MCVLPITNPTIYIIMFICFNVTEMVKYKSHLSQLSGRCDIPEMYHYSVANKVLLDWKGHAFLDIDSGPSNSLSKV